MESVYENLKNYFRRRLSCLPDFKYVLYLILFLLLGVEFFFFIFLPLIRFFLSFRLSKGMLIKQISSVISREVDDIFISVYNLVFRDELAIGETVLRVPILPGRFIRFRI